MPVLSALCVGMEIKCLGLYRCVEVHRIKFMRLSGVHRVVLVKHHKLSHISFSPGDMMPQPKLGC